MKKIEVERKTQNGFERWSFAINPGKKVIYPEVFTSYANNPTPYKNPLLMYIDLREIEERIPENVIRLLTKQMGRQVYQLKGRIKY